MSEQTKVYIENCQGENTQCVEQLVISSIAGTQTASLHLGSALQHILSVLAMIALLTISTLAQQGASGPGKVLRLSGPGADLEQSIKTTALYTGNVMNKELYQ